MSFHLYGFFIGLAICLAAFLMEYQAKKHNLDSNLIGKVLGWVLIGGLIGARAYHVLTDWQLYQYNFFDVFKFWRGGLGIVGGLTGGVLALLLYFLLNKKKMSVFLSWLDISVFALPFSQALGRWGNFFNQELYGKPTTLPWGISIDYQNRASDYLTAEKFHPLFAYESVLMLAFGFAIWFLDQRNKFKVGKANLFLTYLSYYLLIRIWLDFLRTDRQLIWLFFDLNQIIFICLLSLLIAFFCRFKRSITDLE